MRKDLKEWLLWLRFIVLTLFHYLSVFFDNGTFVQQWKELVNIEENKLPETESANCRIAE